MARIRRMRRSRLAFLGLVMAGVVLMWGVSSAAESTPNGTAVYDGIKAFTDQAQQLADQGVLDDAMALTDLDPSGPSGLDLEKAFRDVVGSLPATFKELDPAADPAAVAVELEKLDLEGASAAALKVSTGCPKTGACTDYTPVTASYSAPIATMNVPITIERTVAVPVNLSVPLNSGSLKVEGTTVNVALKLTGTLPLRLDTSKVTTEPTKAFYVAGTPTFTATVSTATDATGVSVAAKLGFTDLTATLRNVTAALSMTAQLRDPDADGIVTKDEFSTASLTDMFTIGRTGSAAGTLDLDTTLTATAPDFTVPFTDNLADGFTFPQIDPAALNPFRNVTPEQVISGFGQAAAALSGAQKVGDVDLPFLDGALSDVMSVSQPMFDFVNQQAVVCGTAEQTPPTGEVPDMVTSGTSVFCQAFVIHDPAKYTVTNVTWHVGTGVSATYDATPTQTDKNKSVAITPSKHAKFTMTADDAFDAYATYDLAVASGAPSGTTAVTGLTTQRPARTAQQLALKLNELGGFLNQADLVTAVGAGAKVLDYDPATKALTFRLRKTFTPPAGKLGVDFGDQLEKSTGIIALGASGGAGVTVNATGVGLDVTIGVLLGQLSNIGEGQPCADPTVMDPPGSSTPALANTTACPANQLDRFFVRTDPAADKPEVFVGDGSVTGTLPTLTGRLGFLSLEATPSAFTLAKKVAADPLLRVDVTTPSGGVAVGPTASVANAIRLRQLLFSLGTYVSPPQINLKFDGTLTAVAKVGNEVPQTTLGTGTVTVAWPDITVGLPTVSVDSSFTDNLKGFNIDPNLFGKHSGATSPSTAPSPTTPAVLTDAVATFTDEVLGQRLENLTDGSFCSVTERTGTTLTCATGLAGGTVNKWRANDEYRVLVGDPLALLWKLLDNMDTVIGGIDGISGGVGAGAVYEKELPFVGVSPKALVRQLTDLKRAATEMRGGPQATIACGLTNANPPTGDPSQLSLATDASKDIFCQVETQKDASAVTWTVPQGGGATPTLTNASDTATVVTPTTATPKTSKITILGSSSDGGHIRSSEHPLGYAVRATFTDEDGEHVVDFPEQSVPATLQDFEAMLESKLGLPAGAFKILPEGTGATRRMKLDLNYGICGYAGATAPALCTSGAKHLPSFSAPLNVDLGATGGLVGAGAAADVSVTYAADARLAMSFAVSSSLDPKVEPETGITVKGRFNAANVNLSANLGPFGVQAGTGGGKPGGGVGVLKVGADFKLANPSATAVSVGSYASGLTGTFTAPTGMGEDCGKIDMLAAHTPEDTDDQSVSGLACGRLSLGLSVGDNVEYIDDVAFKVGALAPDGGFTVTTYIPAQVGTRLADEVLSWDTLLNSLPELLARLEEGLKASSGSGPDGQKIPLIGDALDAGADVVGTVNDEVVPLAQDIGDYIDAALVDCSDPDIECENDPPGCTPGDDGCTENATKEADPTDVERFIGDFIWSELGHDADGLELIRKNAGTAADGERSDVKVTTYCDLSQTPCEATDSLFDIKDVRLTFNIGQAIGTDAENPPAFDIGFDGVPLRVAGAVEAEAGWNLLVDVGLSLAEGPYLVVVDPATPGYDGAGEERPPELFVNAKVQLGAESTTDEICNSEVNDPTGGPAATAISTFSVSSNRCLAGRLGFVSVNMRDESTDAKRTKATIETSLDLRKKDDLDATELTVINFTDLVSGKLKPVAKLKVGAQVNLRFRTGISGTQSAGFPTVLGTFNLDWEFVKSFGGTVTDSATTPLTLGFADIHLDVSAFFNKYLKPTLNEVRNVMGPFKPIIDTLNAPLPVISDLAALVGQPPVTLMGLMELLSGNNLTVIKSLAKFISFAVELANNESFAEGLIPLGPVSGGAFALKSGLAQRKSLGSNPGPSAAQTLINKAGAAYKAGTNLLEKPSLGGGNTAAVAKAKQTGAGLTRDNLPGTFGVPGLTFPFMSDASQIFGFIMGQDVTLVRYDVGTLRATAGFAYNFGPFMIGPVPVTAGIGGSVTLEGRFALGYDTSGLRKVLSGGSGTHLFDGIYIDDLDTNMVDVPEIKLVGEVYARAGITVFVATAGIEGGIRLTIALNLDDRPEPDGKLRIEEIFNKLSNPICLFDVSGKLEAYLKAFVEINYFIGSKKWDWTILEVTLLEFSGACEPPKPQLASNNAGTLTLNMGSKTLRDARKVSTDAVDEKFVVRPAGGGRYSVEAFGVYQVYGPGSPFGGVTITKVIANGDSGNDSITMAPGNDETSTAANTIPFTAVAEITGGAGNDLISGGDAADALHGNEDSDRIDGNLGADTMTGGAGNDQLNGGQGVDDLKGEGGGDRLTGGPSGDTLDGGADDDIVTGGPSADPTVVAAPSPLLDGGDTMTGGTGADSLEGGFGADTINGDTTSSCTDITAGGDDILDGGPEVDTLTGGGGNDKITGGAAGDTLCGNAGHDEMDGDDPSMETTGGGNDTLTGGTDNDALRARSGRDILAGGDGHDGLFGGAGADSLKGDADNDDLIGGTGDDVLDGGAGTNILAGDNATISGADGPATTRRAMPATQAARVLLVTNVGTFGDNLATWLTSCTYPADRSSLTAGDDTGYADCLTGGSGDDVLFGEGGRDKVTGNAGADYMRGGAHNDEMDGDAGTDEMYGDIGDDTMTGGDDKDTMRGNEGADAMEGNDGPDVMRGDADADRMIGGSSTAGPDGADEMTGDEGADVMLGDNGTIAATAPFAAVPSDPGGTTAVNAGNDTMNGGPDSDRMYGGGAVDGMTGEAAADYMEGNGAGDVMAGGLADDDMIGGTSARSTADGSDTMNGNEGFDVMAGDNAKIVPATGTYGQGGLVRTVTLLDVAAAGETPTAGSGTDDTMHGDGDADRMFGQAGVDTMNGNDGRDLVAGNDAGDTINGNAAGDLLIGGTTPHTILKASDATILTFDAAADAIDTISGGDADDMIFGDNIDADFNALVAGETVFPVTPGATTYGNDILTGDAGLDVIWGQLGGDDIDGGTDQDYLVGDQAEVSGDADGAALATWPGGAPEYDVVLFEATNGGADAIKGQADNDHAYGGQGADTMQGGLGDDYLEGNAGTDAMYGLSATHDNGVSGDGDDVAELAATLAGTSDEDDLIGGSSTAVWPAASTTAESDDAETEMYGNADHDVMAGDNADIIRVVDSSDATLWATDLVLTQARRRDVSLRDRTLTTTTTPTLAQVGGADDMFGNNGGDRMYGEGGNDRMKGNDNDDYLEGNQNCDWVEGNDGEDDIVGGSSFGLAANAVHGDPDSTDYLNGGADSDIVVADNAVIARSSTRIPSANVYFQTTGRFLGFTTPRWIQLLDLTRTPTGNGFYGADLVSGGTGEDIAIGQDGNDFVSGGADDDYLEGNGGIDRLHGDDLPWTIGAKSLANPGGHPVLPGTVGAADGSGFRSVSSQLDGAAAADGQDDLLGGSSRAGHRDSQGNTTAAGALPDPSVSQTTAFQTQFQARFGDYLYGNGDDDFILGDNGTLTRFSGTYDAVAGTYMTSIGRTGTAHRLVREAIRFDVGGTAATWGDDFVEGGTGDDAVWAQNGSDEVWGNDGDDDLLGELGADRIYGGAGEDAMLGDRGSIRNTAITEAMRAPGQPFEAYAVNTSGPPFLAYQAFTAHRYDRRINLYSDVADSVGAVRPGGNRTIASSTMTVGGADIMRGGPDHDSMHGAGGDDILNGDTGGDYVFGGHGSDVMWGGRGSTVDSEANLRQPAGATGFDDRWVDYTFGGRGGSTTTGAGVVTGGADVLDFRPRTNYTTAKSGVTASDPASWHQNVAPYKDRTLVVQEQYRQHSHGVDWIYGGWDRDVMQANVAAQGPNDQDRLMDWAGAYNLYTHCEPDYGGYNDIRAISPTMLDAMQRLAYASGAGEARTNVLQANSSGFDELALVYNGDVKVNTGQAYPTTPGNFSATACGADPTP